MSDPQQPPVPPYTTSAGQRAPGQQAPGQHGYPGQQDFHGEQEQNPQPAQQSAQPTQHGQPAPYVQPSQPGQHAYPAGAVRASTNAPGRIGLIIGLISLAITLIISVSLPFAYRGDFWQIASIANGASLVLAVIGSALALTFGIIGLRRAGAPHGSAGIAVGLGIAGLTGAFISMLISTFSWMFYY